MSDYYAGKYNIKIFMDINVTDSFLGLNENTRGCQEKRNHEKCVSKDYVNKIMKKCGCVPISLSLHEQVQKYFYFID